MSFLELKNVHKGFGPATRRTEVLHDVNLTVERGEFLAIVGYSGAGKTTLMSLIAGLARPDTGLVAINNKPIEGPGPDRAIVFQNYSLLPWLSVADNVALAVDQVFPSWPREQRRAHVERYVRMVNLGHAMHKKPAELSGGMRQRVSVARALATDPDVLLLDEPLSALDALTRATLQDEIVRIWEGDGQGPRKTVVLITNDVDEGILLADRIVPMSAGPAATLGPTIPVTLPRPRDRKAINNSDDFKRIRSQVFGWLLGPAGKNRQSSDGDAGTRRRGPQPLPDLKPVDVGGRSPAWFGLGFLRRPQPAAATAVAKEVR
jgi:nitrate/nitrite transport system ATP-binding protein